MTATPPPDAERYLYHRAGPVRLYLGDAATVLAALPPSCVDCVVTSPPYWGHRDYATGSWDGGDPGCPHPPGRPTPGTTCPSCAAVYTDPQLGREATLDAYVANLVAVFTQVRRVLAADGTCWVNLGDSYATAAGGAPAAGRRQPDGTRPTMPGGRDVLPAILWNQRSSIDAFLGPARLPQKVGDQRQHPSEQVVNARLGRVRQRLLVGLEVPDVVTVADLGEFVARPRGHWFISFVTFLAMSIF